MSSQKSRKIAFIVDIRRQNMLHHLLYKALLEHGFDERDLDILGALVPDIAEEVADRGQALGRIGLRP